MKRTLVQRSSADTEAIAVVGNHKDSRRAAWLAIKLGGEVIREIQELGRTQRSWQSLADALPYLNDEARTLLRMRREAIDSLKHAPHHVHGFRLSADTGAKIPRVTNPLCLISGYEGQEIPGLVAYSRVVVDAEHMEQALGPATLAEIYDIRKRVGEHIYISTNVSETPQIVRNLRTGDVDVRATSALTASKVTAALGAGADVVKVGFANLDPCKRDLCYSHVLEQMRQVRTLVDDVVSQNLVVIPLTKTARYPLIGVFFPEIGIDSHGERPREIAEKGITLAAKAKWQGILIDTFEKHTGRRYWDFYSVEDTADLARKAHSLGLDFWVAGSIRCEEIQRLIKCNVDLICFGGAARHRTGVRVEDLGDRKDEAIKRPLVEDLIAEFEAAQ